MIARFTYNDTVNVATRLKNDTGEKERILWRSFFIY